MGSLLTATSLLSHRQVGGLYCILICPRGSASQKSAGMTKFDTPNSRSDETGYRHIAGKAAHPIRRFRGKGGIAACDTALSRDAPRTRMLPCSLSTRKPGRILVSN